MRHRNTSQNPHRNRPRLISRGEDYKVVRIGQRPLIFRDLYVGFLGMPWWVIAVIVFGLYIVSNIMFAGMYYLHGGIRNAHTFMDMFFFSVQTIATIGYGQMSPEGLASNLIVAVESLWGLAYFALVTGLVFAKFSRPTAQVLFSDVAVISNHDGKPHLKIRLANQRSNRIVDARVQLFLLRNVMTKEGHRMRKFYDLKVERTHVPLLQFTWTLRHPIDDQSPMYGVTQDSLEAMDDEIIVMLVGLDETLSQTIHARHSYVAREIVCNAFFEDVLTINEDRVEVNYNYFSVTRPADSSKTGV